jgi:tetratricopeptide (TPR) repeat protein
MLFSVLLQANNFGDGMRAYRNGDYDKAKVLFEIALEKDKIYNASHLLGKMYLNGNGVAVDKEKAIKYFKLAYKYGNITAGCYASSTYLSMGVVNWGILEDGLARGLKHNVKYCYEVVDTWQNK